MSEESIIVERVGENKDIVLLTLNREKALNSFNGVMLSTLESILDELAKSDARVVIITGKGKAFSAGADLKWMSTLDEQTYPELIRKGQEVFKKIEDLPIPVIAAINGFALGGGMELSLACDIRIASENALLGQPEVTIGLPPGWGATYRLQKVAGVSIAKDLILTGRKISAKEALNMHIISAIYPTEELLDKAIELAQNIARNAPLAVKEAKKAINIGVTGSVEDGYSAEDKGAKVCFASNDLKEGIKALFEKRTPKFNGN